MALKKLKSEQIMHQLNEEAAFLQKLSHPHIVQVVWYSLLSNCLSFLGYLMTKKLHVQVLVS